MGKGNSSAEYMRAWREKNKEHLKEYRRESYQANLEENRRKGREKAARRRAANPDHMREVARAWREANPERMRSYGRKVATARYGITPEDYDAMLEKQRGRCAICGTDNPGGRGAFHVDHSHATGRVRGLLCHSCNVGLGMFGDDPSRLIDAVEYLGTNVEVV